MTDLDELERLAKAATPGSRTPYPGGYRPSIYTATGHLALFSVRRQSNEQTGSVAKTHDDAVNDAVFVAACSPDTVLRLVRAARALVDLVEYEYKQPDTRAIAFVEATAAVAQLREGTK